jgi:hypothetical protein
MSMTALKTSVNTATAIPQPVTGNGSEPINGRGVLHCLPDRRLDLAVEAVLGLRPFQPSITQAVPVFQVSRAELVERIEHFRALAGNGSEQSVSAVEANGNGHDVVVEDHAVPKPDEVNGIIARAVVDRLLDMTPAQRVEVARMLGPDWFWNALISPVLQSKHDAPEADDDEPADWWKELHAGSGANAS